MPPGANHIDGVIDGGDLLIVGAGLAGLCVALQAPCCRITLLSPHPLGDGCASAWAQGGIAAALHVGDHAGAHARDTIAAGGGIVDARQAQLLSEAIPAAVEELAALGVPFDRNAEGEFSLGREAAHSQARILRVGGDGAGRAIMLSLVAALGRLEHVRVLEGMEARDLLLAEGRVVGVSASDNSTGGGAGGNGAGETIAILARRVVLACGGIGQLYRHTTNPAASRGAGLAMAARAGAILADMEFVQFHPTAIDTGSDPLPLATEALRGEGASLINHRGIRFLRRVHPLAELAPRDIVARAIARERRHGRTFLDTRSAIGAQLPQRFPAVYRACVRAGIDPLGSAIPVLPAAHYHMGGISIDARGRTSLPGLWACGETASSGCHGANRLAGNSLGEALVFAKRIAQDTEGDDRPPPNILAALKSINGEGEGEGAGRGKVGAIREAGDILRLRAGMSRLVGLCRDEDGLRLACARFLSWRRRARPGGRLADMATTALLIAAAALTRRESRGCHFRSDFPDASLPPQRSRITLKQAEAIAQEALDCEPPPQRACR